MNVSKLAKNLSVSFILDNIERGHNSNKVVVPAW